MKGERRRILEKDDELKKDISPKHKYILFLGLTFTLGLSLFSVGAALSITGPILLELAKIVKVNVSVISWVLTTKGFGIGVGSMTRGHLMDLTRCRVISPPCIAFVFAVSIGAIPWCSYLAAMLPVFFLQGLMMGIIEADCNDYCIQIWGKDHAPYLLAVYSFVMVGGVIAPLLAIPFLSTEDVSETPFNGTPVMNQSESQVKERSILNNRSLTDTQTLHQSNFSQVEGDSVVKRMATLHFIIAAVALVAGLLRAVMSYLTRHWESYAPKDEFSLEGQKVSKPCPRNVLVSLFSSYIFIIIGVNNTYTSLLTAFVVKQLHEGAHLGSVMTTTAWSVGTLGSFIAIPLSVRLSASIMVLIHLIIANCAVILFAVAGGFSTTAVWFSSILLGYTIGPVYAGTFTWASRYIELSVKVSSIIMASSMLGSMAFPAITGSFLDSNPLVLAYTYVGACGLCVIVYALAEVLGKRFLPQEISERSL